MVVLSNSRKTRLLVIEDVRYLARFLQFLLEKEGYEVALANSGEQALEMIEGFKPDGILLDLMLPGISGTDVLRQLRSQNEYDKIVVIILTSQPSRERASEIIELGAHTYCSKPVAPSTLFRLLLESGLPPSIDPFLQTEDNDEFRYTNN